MAATTLTDRSILRLSGDGVHDFLQGIITNDIALLAPHRPIWAALLSAQGKALFDFILWSDGTDVLVDCEKTRADELVKKLSMYRLRRPITIARDDDLAVHWSPGADEGLPDPRLAALGHRWLAPSGPAANDYHHRRIALGIPEGAAELGIDKTLWLEANAVELGGVSFTKGCYVGQENTARMHHRDKLRRRLLPLRLESDPGDATDVRTDDNKSAGELRARVADVAMAWLRLELIDNPLSIGGAHASVLTPDWLD